MPLEIGEAGCRRFLEERLVERIVREEMDRAGYLEMLMPAVQPAELWKETGRWDDFGDQLLKLHDRAGRDYVFGPTHEEVITDLARNELRSYKQLPVTFYQIQTKFRDEIRPRFGVMRAREFLMKDAYSFHIDEASLDATYWEMYEVYSRIFTRAGLEFRAVRADSGAIGGSQSHEFHVLADSGEDQIAFSTDSDFAANVELAEAMPDRAEAPAPGEDLRLSFLVNYWDRRPLPPLCSRAPSRRIISRYCAARPSMDRYSLPLRGVWKRATWRAPSIPTWALLPSSDSSSTRQDWLASNTW